MTFVPSRSPSNKRPYIPPNSLDLKLIESIKGQRVRRVGSYGATRYGRCVYGTQAAVYGKDKYNQATYG